jgi:hypothetical protein
MNLQQLSFDLTQLSLQGDVWYCRNKKVNTKKSTYNWSPWVKLIVSPGGRIVGGGTLPGHAGGLPTA